MKKIFTLIFIVSLFLSALTNPNKNSYIGWLKENSANKSSNILEKGVISLAVGTIGNNYTTTKDYLFFTIYDTKFSDEDLKVVGIFNNFVPIKVPKDISK